MNTPGESIDNARLIISRVDFDDAGEYKCWAAESTRYQSNDAQAILVHVSGMPCSLVFASSTIISMPLNISRILCCCWVLSVCVCVSVYVFFVSFHRIEMLYAVGVGISQ
jgi:hypothetical protein